MSNGNKWNFSDKLMDKWWNIIFTIFMSKRNMSMDLRASTVSNVSNRKYVITVNTRDTVNSMNEMRYVSSMISRNKRK